MHSSGANEGAKKREKMEEVYKFFTDPARSTPSTWVRVSPSLTISSSG
jgi:hypothetical protein